MTTTSTLTASLHQDAQSLAPQLVAWRRDFHQHPELGFQEVRTAGVVADHLRAQGAAAARVAWHLLQAGAEVEAVPWHLAAARAARERWQLAEAARSFEAAARGMERQARERKASDALLANETKESVAMTWLQAARWWPAPPALAPAASRPARPAKAP